MDNFTIVPLPTEIAERWRATRTDDYGNPLAPIVADDPGAFPCRHCLRDAAVGEPMLLASHSPFALPGPYKEVGPVFVHERACEKWQSTSEIPAQVRRRLLALRGYDRTQKLLEATVVEGVAIEGALTRLFARDDVAFVQVRFAIAGCFGCRIDRV